MGGFLFIAIGAFIIAPLPLDGSWLYFWEMGPDPWFTVSISAFMILAGLFLLVIGLKTSSSSQKGTNTSNMIKASK
jgi:small neutral amino acid transporter SnatA (MarC family)